MPSERLRRRCAVHSGGELLLLAACSLGPTPEELAEQAARLQEELNLKQVREQMGHCIGTWATSTNRVCTKPSSEKGRISTSCKGDDLLDGKFLVVSIDPMTVKLEENPPPTSKPRSISRKRAIPERPEPGCPSAADS